VGSRTDSCCFNGILSLQMNIWTEENHGEYKSRQQVIHSRLNQEPHKYECSVTATPTCSELLSLRTGLYCRQQDINRQFSNRSFSNGLHLYNPGMYNCANSVWQTVQQRAIHANPMRPSIAIITCADYLLSSVCYCGNGKLMITNAV
jgi:hypothetical protein